MMKRTLKLILAITVAWSCATATLPAQTTNKAAAGRNETTTEKKKQTSGPFRGHLAAVDKAARTVTVGKRTFHVTSDTKIFKGGKPATLADGNVGEEASGGFKTAEDGRLVATKLTFGPKVDPGQTTEKVEKKKSAK